MDLTLLNDSFKKLMITINYAIGNDLQRSPNSFTIKKTTSHSTRSLYISYIFSLGVVGVECIASRSSSASKLGRPTAVLPKLANR
jgi:hypothetical protein